MTSAVLTAKEAQDLVTRLGPSLGCGDFTYGARFPKGRTDVCVVRRMAENGRDYGYDTLYLIWKNKEGALRHYHIVDSSRTKNYLEVDKITADGDQVTVSYSGSGYAAPEKGEKTLRLG